MDTKVKTIAMLLIGIIVGGIAGYGIGVYQSQLGSPEVVGKDLHVAMSVEQRDMSALGYAETMWNVYEGLLLARREQTTGRTIMVPWLAESWNVTGDGLVFEFRLREGVRFHDGTTFNATAAKFSFERANVTTVPPSPDLRNVKSVEIVDTYRIRFTLKNLDWAAECTVFGACNIVSPSYVLKNAVNVTTENPYGDWGQKWMFNHACGTGPYSFAGWLVGERFTMERFDDYWGGWKPNQNIQNIVVHYIKETSTQKMMIEKGDIDVAFDILKRDFVALNATGNVLALIQPRVTTIMLMLDNSEPPFNDVRVRRAVAYALDYDAIVNVEPYETRRYGAIDWVIYGESARDPGFVKFAQNLTKAKKLLIEAGYLDSAGTPIKTTPLKIVYLAGGRKDVYRMCAEIIKVNLAPLGFEVTIEELVITMLYAYSGDTSKYDMQLRQGTVYYDPSQAMINHFKSTAGPQFAVARYKNSEFDALLDAAKKEYDLEERLPLWAEAEKMLFSDDVGSINLIDDPYQIIMRKGVKGFKGFVFGQTGSMREFNAYDLYIED